MFSGALKYKPTGLITTNGTVGFVGAVVTNKPNPQVVVNPLVLFSHHTNLKIRATAAQYCGALRKAIHSLRENCRSFLPTIDPTDHPGFPYHRQFKSLDDGKTHRSTYENQVDDKLVFVGETDERNGICIRFVHTYSKDSGHLRMCKDWVRAVSQGLRGTPRPMVYGCHVRKLTVAFSVSANRARLLCENAKQKITDQHQATFAHGDIRDVNFLVKEDSEDPHNTCRL